MLFYSIAVDLLHIFKAVSFKCGTDLLRDFKANVGTKSEHVLHLLWCSGDQWDV